MQIKHGVTGIIFDEKNGHRYFLILHRVLNWSGWEFVKGGIDKGESPEIAVLREVDEETSLENIKVISTLPEKVSWTADNTKYVYVPFILRGHMDELINLDQEVIEHDEYKWVRENEVESFLTHNDNKKIFREALEVLEK